MFATSAFSVLMLILTLAFVFDISFNLRRVNKNIAKLLKKYEDVHGAITKQEINREEKIFILSNFLTATAHVLNVVLGIFYWLILIRALLSWVSPDPYNPIVQFLERYTEPVLAPIRRVLPPSFKFGIDISPLIAFLAIMFIRSFLVNTLLDLAVRLK